MADETEVKDRTNGAPTGEPPVAMMATHRSSAPAATPAATEEEDSPAAMWRDTPYYSRIFEDESTWTDLEKETFSKDGAGDGFRYDDIQMIPELRHSYVEAVRHVRDMLKTNTMLQIMEKLPGQHPLPPDNATDQEMIDWGRGVMVAFNYNMVAMAAAAGKMGMDSDVTPEQKQAFLYLMDVHERTNVTWGSFGLATLGVLSDPTTYIGLGTLGLGTIAAQGGKVALKQGVRTAVRQAFIHEAKDLLAQGVAREVVQQTARRTATRMAVNMTARTAAIGATEGGVYAGLDNALRQSAEISEGRRHTIDWAKIGIATSFGVGAGAVFGGFFPAAPHLANKYVLKPARTFFTSAWEKISGRAANRTATHAADTAARAAARIVPDAPVEMVSAHGPATTTATTGPRRIGFGAEDAAPAPARPEGNRTMGFGDHGLQPVAEAADDAAAGAGRVDAVGRNVADADSDLALAAQTRGPQVGGTAGPEAQNGIRINLAPPKSRRGTANTGANAPTKSSIKNETPLHPSTKQNGPLKSIWRLITFPFRTTKADPTARPAGNRVIPSPFRSEIHDILKWHPLVFWRRRTRQSEIPHQKVPHEIFSRRFMMPLIERIDTNLQDQKLIKSILDVSNELNNLSNRLSNRIGNLSTESAKTESLILLKDFSKNNQKYLRDFADSLDPVIDELQLQKEILELVRRTASGDKTSPDINMAQAQRLLEEKIQDYIGKHGGSMDDFRAEIDLFRSQSYHNNTHARLTEPQINALLEHIRHLKGTAIDLSDPNGRFITNYAKDLESIIADKNDPVTLANAIKNGFKYFEDIGRGANMRINNWENYNRPFTWRERFGVFGALFFGQKGEKYNVHQGLKAPFENVDKFFRTLRSTYFNPEVRTASVTDIELDFTKPSNAENHFLRLIGAMGSREVDSKTGKVKPLNESEMQEAAGFFKRLYDGGFEEDAITGAWLLLAQMGKSSKDAFPEGIMMELKRNPPVNGGRHWDVFLDRLQKVTNNLPHSPRYFDQRDVLRILSPFMNSVVTGRQYPNRKVMATPWVNTFATEPRATAIQWLLNYPLGKRFQMVEGEEGKLVSKAVWDWGFVPRDEGAKGNIWLYRANPKNWPSWLKMITYRPILLPATPLVNATKWAASTLKNPWIGAIPASFVAAGSVAHVTEELAEWQLNDTKDFQNHWYTDIGRKYFFTPTVWATDTFAGTPLRWAAHLAIWQANNLTWAFGSMTGRDWGRPLQPADGAWYNPSSWHLRPSYLRYVGVAGFTPFGDWSDDKSATPAPSDESAPKEDQRRARELNEINQETLKQQELDRIKQETLDQIKREMQESPMEEESGQNQNGPASIGSRTPQNPQTVLAVDRRGRAGDPQFVFANTGGRAGTENSQIALASTHQPAEDAERKTLTKEQQQQLDQLVAELSGLEEELKRRQDFAAQEKNEEQKALLLTGVRNTKGKLSEKKTAIEKIDPDFFKNKKLLAQIAQWEVHLSNISPAILAAVLSSKDLPEAFKGLTEHGEILAQIVTLQATVNSGKEDKNLTDDLTKFFALADQAEREAAKNRTPAEAAREKTIKDLGAKAAKINRLDDTNYASFMKKYVELNGGAALTKIEVGTIFTDAQNAVREGRPLPEDAKNLLNALEHYDHSLLAQATGIASDAGAAISNQTQVEGNDGVTAGINNVLSLGGGILSRLGGFTKATFNKMSAPDNKEGQAWLGLGGGVLGGIIGTMLLGKFVLDKFKIPFVTPLLKIAAFVAIFLYARKGTHMWLAQGEGKNAPDNINAPAPGATATPPENTPTEPAPREPLQTLDDTVASEAGLRDAGDDDTDGEGDTGGDSGGGPDVRNRTIASLRANSESLARGPVEPTADLIEEENVESLQVVRASSHSGEVGTRIRGIDSSGNRFVSDIPDLEQAFAAQAGGQNAHVDLSLLGGHDRILLPREILDQQRRLEIETMTHERGAEAVAMNVDLGNPAVIAAMTPRQAPGMGPQHGG
jgi:hypothetical protein